MRKFVLSAYFILTIGFGLSFVSWLTASDACTVVYRIAREGDSWGGICAGDGKQYIGFFVFTALIAAVYLAVSLLVLKLLGYKITRQK